MVLVFGQDVFEFSAIIEVMSIDRYIYMSSDVLISYVSIIDCDLRQRLIHIKQN